MQARELARLLELVRRAEFERELAEFAQVLSTALRALSEPAARPGLVASTVRVAGPDLQAGIERPLIRERSA